MTNRGAAASDVDLDLLGGPAPLPWLLRRTNQRYRFAIRVRLAECGFDELPQPGYWALMILARGGTDASQLIREMGVSKQAVSKLVDALVTMGFVVRKPNSVDRRRSDLRLSAKGSRAATVIEEAARTTDDTFAKELGVKRFADLVKTLTRVARQEA